MQYQPEPQQQFESVPQPPMQQPEQLLIQFHQNMTPEEQERHNQKVLQLL